MQLNQGMQEILGRHGIDPVRPAPLEPPLAQLLRSGLVQEDGCWLLASQVETPRASQRDLFPDRTGYEAFINHLHISDVLEPGAGPTPGRILSQAIAWARELEALLAPRGDFEIVVAVDREAVEDCNVRFYRRRPGERWLDDDLESYAQEGLLVLRTPPITDVAG